MQRERVFGRLERRWLRWRAVVVMTFPNGRVIEKHSDWYFRKALAEIELKYLSYDAKGWIKVLAPIKEKGGDKISPS